MVYNVARKSHFPYEEYRGDQQATIETIVDYVQSGKKCIELSGPTASGKTVVMYTAGRMLVDLGHRVLYTSPQVELINQIDSKFDLPSVKGLKNYNCPYLGDKYTAKDCVFTGSKRLSRKMCPCVQDDIEDDYHGDIHCPYFRDRHFFDEAAFGATTLAFALVDPRILSGKDVVFIDESASLENALIGLLTFQTRPDMVPFSLEKLERYINKLSVEIELLRSKADTTEGIADSDAIIISPDVDVTYILRSTSAKSYSRGEILDTLISAYRRMSLLWKLIALEGEPYIVLPDGNLKLIYGRNILKHAFGNRTLIFASGTPTTNLLLPQHEITRVVMKHPIPVENRQVYFIDLGVKLTMSSNIPIQQRYRKVADAISALETEHGRRHTIVHCSAYSHLTGILSNLKTPAKIFAQTSASVRDQVYQDWKAYPGRSIYLCVGREEGIDLKGQDYNLNIVAKLSWSNKGDPWISKRLSKDQLDGKVKLYEVECAVKLMQSAGRTTRSPTDFSMTFVLEPLPDSLGKHLQPWFKEAMKSAYLDDVVGE